MRQGRTSNIPLVRVEDGTHVLAESDGQPQAFLPSTIKTDFPTVPRSMCSTPKSLEFLKALGLTEPDAVDDVVRNIIPKYKKGTVEADEYEAATRMFSPRTSRAPRSKPIAASSPALSSESSNWSA